MSIQRAIELIAGYLPEPTRSEALALSSTLKDAERMELPYFSLGLADLNNGRWILSRRVRHSFGQTALRVQKQLDFLDRSIARGANEKVWQAYLIQGERRHGFLINPASGEVLHTDAPCQGAGD